MSILDIKVRTEKDERINIEVQVRNDDNFRKRSLYYWSKLYGETISKADTYDQLKKSIVINILKYSFIEETKKYHTTYKLLEKEENFLLVDDIEIHYIELEKFDNEKDVDQFEGVELWLDFIKEVDKKGSQERLEKLKGRSDKIKMAVEMIKKISADEKILEKYLEREKARMDEMSRLKYAEIKGREEGKKEGREEGREEGVKALIIKLLTKKLKNIPEDIINKIKNSNNLEILDKLSECIFEINSIKDIEEFLK